jgi:class 3 adenylate cyclase
MREPSQVFTLLETIFHEFDVIAHRRRVFKVETVGDCYVAVCGLPDPRKDHAVVMARFARDCLFRFSVVTKQLENVLGPDTSDLGMRFGLHSGSVTAGVLRGERSRFQLFGDTMNTAARIESTGARNKIHISIETAEILASQGKGHWCVPREDNVVAKGKGELKTYWLVLKGDNAQSSRSGSSSDGADDAVVRPASQGLPSHQQAASSVVEKSEKLARWNAEILARFLKEIVASRAATGVTADPVEAMRRLEAETSSLDSTVLDEVTDVVNLPDFKAVSTGTKVDPETVELPAQVTEQLRNYIVTIGNLYRDNSFHSFEHASHVTMSAVKLLSRIVAPDIDSSDDQDLHDHTYGIKSDPITQFTVVLSALVHDLDHTGVPNSTLIKEQASIAAAYKNKSVAEQNSVDIAWELLMQPEYADLRRAIYVNEGEFRRFRQLLVNLVLATDIMDKDLGVARKARWNRAFAKASAAVEEAAGASGTSSDGSAHDRNLKANIVLEHLIQASDVAHTMQHFTIYRKWNECLFGEMYKAYQAGRSDKDPAESWYEGEMGFFDHYVIPLARKLKECGVFGVSSDEYLDYAEKNRREWEVKGREIVREMVEAKQKR